EKGALPRASFAQLLQARISGSKLLSIEKLPTERIVRISFQSSDNDEGEPITLLVQLTGRAANLLLLDHENRIIETLRRPRGEGQQKGELYQLPPPQQTHGSRSDFQRSDNPSPSADADAYFTQIDVLKAWEARVRSLRGRVQQLLSQKQKLHRNLESDLQAHGDPESHKRIGDLLLANIGTAIRNGPVVEITDYYSEGSPKISIEVDE